MKGLKVFLGVSCVFLLAFGLMNLFMPAQMAEWKLGPADVTSARHMGSNFMALFAASVYAFRSPKKNVAIINVIILGFVLAGLVGIWNGLTGEQAWSAALSGIIACGVITAGLAVFYPRGEKPA